MDRDDKQKIRQRVLERDGAICCYCQTKLAIDVITLDHIIPDSQGGAFNTTNLTIACKACNRKRGDKPFYEFIKAFNFSEEKITKFQKLSAANLRIKVLNLAKEQLINYFEIPQYAIEKVCNILNIPIINYNDLSCELSFNSFQKRKDIIFAFEQLIHCIEEIERG